jgi:hypothetical protein
VSSQQEIFIFKRCRSGLGGGEDLSSGFTELRDEISGNGITFQLSMQEISWGLRAILGGD